ncbi:methyl-CpG-binding domain-containing protein 5-like [Silene latifolia]|uniref:methyl-CpG-binding domain-containing protein 5-like n=1 Tax=Silene latifolia TaxID=37657 RepID=UPI003D77C0EF
MENRYHIDPLLNPGAFINPNPVGRTPVSNGHGKPKGRPKGEPKGEPRGEKGSNPRQTSVEVTDEKNRPDWLPPGWGFRETLRTSSASAGTRDKYFICPTTNSRFRSKKEVFRYLETGVTPIQKRKAGTSDADNMSGPNSAAPKQKKTETKPKPTPKPKTIISIENFKFDDIPEKVKWELTDVYAATWIAKIDDANPVLEPTKQEWSAAFKYLSLKSGDAIF